LRILLFTGKGGVGKTTAAAGTASRAAALGHRTLLLSTDAAHSLSDVFATPIGPDPTSVADLLFVSQVDAQRHLELSWREVQGYLLRVLESAGMDLVTAEELTVLPGAEEVLALLELRAQVRSGQWDVVVVDCAPTAETLRLLALPEALAWYLDRVLPADGRLLRALRPVVGRAAGVPMPEDTVVDAMERLRKDLAEVHDLLTGEDASVRLVLTPEALVLSEARRSLTTLSLFGYRVDGVVANRVFPSEGADDWRRTWVAAQQRVLDDVDASFGGVPVWRSSYRSSEPVGVDALRQLAQDVYGEVDPVAPCGGPRPLTIDRTRGGATVRIALPFVAQSEIGLARAGDELVVTVGSYRRLVALPAAMRNLAVAGARLDDGALKVRFGTAPEVGA
jgi:arsenite/tail-anchored protein-transporting ATPase